jgi:hypothetical protein
LRNCKECQDSHSARYLIVLCNAILIFLAGLTWIKSMYD